MELWLSSLSFEENPKACYKLLVHVVLPWHQPQGTKSHAWDFPLFSDNRFSHGIFSDEGKQQDISRLVPSICKSSLPLSFHAWLFVFGVGISQRHRLSSRWQILDVNVWRSRQHHAFASVPKREWSLFSITLFFTTPHFSSFSIRFLLLRLSWS